MQANQPNFSFAIAINPAFQDAEKPNEQFYTMTTYDVNKNSISGQWAFCDNPTNIPSPYYAGIIQKTPMAQEVEFLVTGGIFLSEEGMQTSNYCFRFAFFNKMDCMRLQFLSQKPGEVTEVDGEEVQGVDDLVPPMKCPRHNHKLFELRKPNSNEYVYLAVGGQYIAPDSCGILNVCEVLDERHEVSPGVLESQWLDVAPMNFYRSGCSGFVLQNKVYVFGGLTFENDKQTFLNSKQSEVFDYQLNKWTVLNLKWKLGLQAQYLGAFCLPISDSKVVIFGGSNGTASPTDQIAVLDLQKLQVEGLKTKLGVGRAGMQGRVLKNIKVTRVIRTELNEQLTNEFNDYLVLLGGATNEISFDLFKIVSWDKFELEHVLKEDISDQFTSDVTGMYKLFGLQNQQAWIGAMNACPVLLYI